MSAMKLSDLIQAVSSRNLLTKVVQQGVIEALKRLEHYERTMSMPPDRAIRYLNRQGKEECSEVIAYSERLCNIAMNWEKQGLVKLSNHLYDAAGYLYTAFHNRKLMLDDASQEALTRFYNHHGIKWEAKDVIRTSKANNDDPVIEVESQDVYEVAADAIAECNRECDGNKAQCERRDRYIKLSIPWSENVNPLTGSYINCPYYNGELTPMEIAASKAKGA